MFKADDKIFVTAGEMAAYIVENIPEEAYDDMIDECYPEIEIMGLTYAPSIAFYRTDPIAYRVYFDDWLDGEWTEIEYDLNRMIDGETETYYNIEVSYYEEDEEDEEDEEEE